MTPGPQDDARKPEQVNPDHTILVGSKGAAPMQAMAFAPELGEEEAGEMLGPFKLVERLGRGTFGSVWRATRTQPFEQEVAIKIMRKDVASAEGPAATQARFDLERQVLAELDHPGIARVFDGGVSEKGRNYFVMELVRGVPITQFCDERQLSIRDRLELFIQVCEAVHYAHQHGVLHRDLKPGNILAFQAEGQQSTGHSGLRAKVIDFGLAKVTLRASSVRHQFVERGLALGTPEYMSPEQAAGEVAIDARTDIYGLGAVLYELLVGAAPFDAKWLRSRGLEAMVKALRESDPPSPSERLSSLASSVEPAVASSIATLCKARGMDARRLLDLLRRELNLLPMKAMRRNPSDRYRSAVELADDMRNYLEGRPLIAAPPSATYRARKFVRRHWGAVVATAAVAASLVAATVLSTWFGLAEAEARRVAEERREQVTKIAKFQQQMLAQVDPQLAGADLLRSLERRLDEALHDRRVPDRDRAAAIERLREGLRDVNPTDAATDFMDQVILRPASVAASSDYADQPVVKAGLQQTLSQIYYQLGMADEALPLQKSAVELRSLALGPMHRDTLDSSVWLGRVLQKTSQPDMATAATLLKDALDARTRQFGPDDPDTRDSLESLAFLEKAQGNRDAALGHVQRLLVPSGNARPEERGRTAATLSTLLLDLGQPAEAVKVLERAQAEFPPDRYRNRQLELLVMNNLALAQLGLAKAMSGTGDTSAEATWDAAQTSYRTVLERAAGVLGEENPLTLEYRNGLAVTMLERGRAAEAKDIAEKGVALAMRGPGAAAPCTLRLQTTVVQARSMLGDGAGAWTLAEAAEQAGLASPMYDPELLLDLRKSAASVAESAGRLEDAEKRLRAVHQAYQAMVNGGKLKAEDIPAIDAATNLGRVLTARGSHAEANAVLSAAVSAAMKRRPDSGALWAATTQLLASSEAWAKAEPSSAVAQTKLAEARARAEQVRQGRESFLAAAGRP